MNLTETRTFTIKVIIVVVGLITAYYTGVFIYGLGVKAYQAAFPPDPILPEAKFGRLPKLKMTSLTLNGAPTYSLATKTGSLPNIRDRIKVYKTVKPAATLLSEQNLKKTAEALFFKPEYTKLSNSDFQWVDGENQRSLIGNVVSGNYNLSSDLDKIQTALNTVGTITEKDALSKTVAFARTRNLFTKEELDTITLKSTPTIIQLNKLRDAKLVPNQTKMIKVDVFRNLPEYQKGSKTKIAKLYRILGENPNESNISFYITNQKDLFKFPIADINLWKIDYTSGTEYFLSSVASVWDAIKENKGIIAYAKLDEADYFESYVPLDIKNIEIRTIDLAYYESKEYLEYLQPMYVFEGIFETKTKAYGELPKKGSIIIYYPAVRGDWVKS